MMASAADIRGIPVSLHRSASNDGVNSPKFKATLIAQKILEVRPHDIECVIVAHRGWGFRVLATAGRNHCPASCSTIEGELRALSLAMGARPTRECCYCSNVIAAAVRVAHGASPGSQRVPVGPQTRPLSYYVYNTTRKRVSDDERPSSTCLCDELGSEGSRPQSGATLNLFLRALARREPGLVGRVAQLSVGGCSPAACPMREGRPPPDPQWAPRRAENDGTSSVLTSIVLSDPIVGSKDPTRWVFLRGQPGVSLRALRRSDVPALMVVEQTSSSMVVAVVSGGPRAFGAVSAGVPRILAQSPSPHSDT